MAVGTMNVNNIYVSTDNVGYDRVNGPRVFPSDNQHVQVYAPTEGWEFGKTYFIIVTQRVLTIDNQPLAEASRLQFKVYNDPGIKVYLEDELLSFDVYSFKIIGYLV